MYYLLPLGLSDVARSLKVCVATTVWHAAPLLLSVDAAHALPRVLSFAGYSLAALTLQQVTGFDAPCENKVGCCCLCRLQKLALVPGWFAYAKWPSNSRVSYCVCTAA